MSTEKDTTEELISRLEAPPASKSPASDAVVAKRLLTKNARKSRKPLGKGGKGNPKKGGAGSKTVWGKPGCELYETGEALDECDPNYDSEAHDDSFTEEPRFRNEEQFLHEVKNILQEFFETGDINEVADELRELENTKDYINYVHGIVSMALEMALEHRPCHRELVSALIADICAAGIIQPSHVATGFSKVARDLADLAVDNPDAVETVGRFIARAIADNCLSEGFIKERLEKENDPAVVEAAHVAKGLVSDRRQVFRLDGIWVPVSRYSESLSISEPQENSNDSATNGSSPRSRNRFDSGSGASYRARPVLLLIYEMQALLKEYLAAGDVGEFIKQLRAVDVPHFHHELIYEILIMIVSQNKETTLEALSTLIAKLVSESVVTQRQVIQAYRRFTVDFDDLAIDYPLARQWIERYAAVSKPKNIHKIELFNFLPLKGEVDSNAV